MEDTTQILENNKLIAEFMGGLYNNQARLSLQSDEIWLPYHGVCNYKTNNGKSLKYHNDWNWLMKVVEKIESLKTPYNGFSWGIIPFAVVINSNSVYIQVDAGKSEDIIFPDRHCKNKIEMVYNTCVEFIKWYNENKQD